MTNQSSDLSFTLSQEAAASFHDDGVVILHTGKGSLFTANRIGARIWRGIEQQLSLEAIANGISDAHQVASNTAREHTIRFLAQLEQQTLIQREVA
jgi:UDP-N-acetylglucosamine transferase subunit ALG13